jgi:hypothetical protein
MYVVYQKGLEALGYPPTLATETEEIVLLVSHLNNSN